MSPPPALRCSALTVAYTHEPVLVGVDLTVRADEVVAVLGPSGSGKSTLLACVAGFVAPRDGEVHLAGRLVASSEGSVPPESRDVGVVFQHYALWPHLSAVDTVAYPLRRRGVPAAEAHRQAAGLLERMGIGGLAARRPAQLSGGQQQRVGLARALARAASMYLFDEPTAHLDTALRAALQEEMTERRRAGGAAALYATHDAGEALAVADRVALLRAGHLVQVGTPTEVYEQPVDLWAARLTGPASVLTVPAEAVGEDKVVLTLGDETIRIGGGRAAGATGQAGTVLVRPEWAELGGPLPGTVRQTCYRGPHTDYRLDTPAGSIDIRQAGTPAARRGERVTWSLHRAWATASTGDGS
jgi:ABC-type Fe3+/spermidine/putrescine transport system ATPase subunit